MPTTAQNWRAGVKNTPSSGHVIQPCWSLKSVPPTPISGSQFKWEDVDANKQLSGCRPAPMLAATSIINTQVLIPNIHLTRLYLMPSLRQALCQALGIQESVRLHLSLKELESCFLYYKSERKAGVREIHFLSSSPESQGHAMPIVNTKTNLLALIGSAGYRHCT